MSQGSDELWALLHNAATNAVQSYGRDILTVETLMDLMQQELTVLHRREQAQQLSYTYLWRLAQRICSRALHYAWRSTEEEVRNHAFENLRRHLELSLQHIRYAKDLRLYAYASEDVLHQTLEALHLMLTHESNPGPDDPATFLRWTQTILIRNAAAFLEKSRREEYLSLDEQLEHFPEQFVDSRNSDPLNHVLRQEVQQTLGWAIASMHNPHYRQVLLYTYLAGLDEAELASQLGVDVQTVYLWHHRALKSLRSKGEVMKLLHSLCHQ
jgi:RNA polymerase sigma factor (sigma-70 family)